MNHLKALLVVLILIFAGWVGFRIWQQASSSSRSSGEVSSAVAVELMEKQGIPDFTVKNIKNEQVALRDLAGKVVILNFWASWCGPCVEEVPSLIKLVKQYKGRVHLLAISGDSQLADIEVFLKSFPELRGADIDIIWDEDRSLMKSYGVARLPESFVAGPDLKLAKKLVGSIDWYTADSKEYMEGLLKAATK